LGQQHAKFIDGVFSDKRISKDGVTAGTRYAGDGAFYSAFPARDRLAGSRRLSPRLLPELKNPLLEPYPCPSESDLFQLHPSKRPPPVGTSLVTVRRSTTAMPAAAAAEPSAIRKLGPLFKLTEVHLW
jgi:hypothetical protein